MGHFWFRRADQFEEALTLFGAYKLAGHSPSLTVYTTLIANLSRNARKNMRRSDGLRALALWSEMCSLRVTLDQVRCDLYPAIITHVI
eukprot:1179354-Prorocentrum_minimum.AAC.3